MGKIKEKKMKIFNLNKEKENGKVLIHLSGDRDNYSVTYDHGKLFF